MPNPPPSVQLCAILDLHVEWPTHGRSLQLGEVRALEGEPIDEILPRVWAELLRVARELGVSSPCLFRAVRLTWPARGGTSGSLVVHPSCKDGAGALRREIVSALGQELIQFGFDWQALREAASVVPGRGSLPPPRRATSGAFGAADSH